MLAILTCDHFLVKSSHFFKYLQIKLCMDCTRILQDSNKWLSLSGLVGLGDTISRFEFSFLLKSVNLNELLEISCCGLQGAACGLTSLGLSPPEPLEPSHVPGVSLRRSKQPWLGALSDGPMCTSPDKSVIVALSWMSLCDHFVP